jgi:hypothetical protein
MDATATARSRRFCAMQGGSSTTSGSSCSGQADGFCIRLRPQHRNLVWTYDFVEDRTRNGAPLPFVGIILRLIMMTFVMIRTPRAKAQRARGPKRLAAQRENPGRDRPGFSTARFAVDQVGPHGTGLEHLRRVSA